VLGRWIRRDPAGYVSNGSLVAYCNDRPARQLDSHGFASHCASCSSAQPETPPRRIRPVPIGPSTPDPNTPKVTNCPEGLFSPSFWSDLDIQPELDRVRASCGCTPTITCIQCDSNGTVHEDGRTYCTGLFGRGCPRIEICIDKMGRHAGNINTTIKHELAHARQCCTQGYVFSCEARLCREIDAYTVDGSCDHTGNSQECLCANACDSIGSCGTVDECMRRCRSIFRDCRNGQYNAPSMIHPVDQRGF
jgi:hypothetical protein